MKKIKMVLLTAVLGSFSGLWLGWWKAAPRQVVGNQVIQRQATDEVRFFVLGDTGSGNDNQLAVAAAMEAACKAGSAPVGILLLGDNFYMDGVESTSDSQWQSKMWAPYGGPCLGNIPIFAVLGNHDYKGKPEVQIAMSGQNPRWVMPARNYAVRFGNLLELDVLDSNFVDYCFSALLCAKDFLQARLSQPGVTWRFGLAHHPLVSSSTKYPDTTFAAYRKSVQPILCGNADLFLSGHAHHMEHARLEKCSTHFFIFGGGGADLVPVLEGKAGSQFARAMHGFGDMIVTSNSIDVKFVGKDGATVYRSQILKRKTH